MNVNIISFISLPGDVDGRGRDKGDVSHRPMRYLYIRLNMSTVMNVLFFFLFQPKRWRTQS